MTTLQFNMRRRRGNTALYFFSRTKNTAFNEEIEMSLFIFYRKERFQMREFKIPTNPYCDGRLYWKSRVRFFPGITCLVGCNGSGKTTLLHEIREQLKKEPNVLVLDYDDRMNGGSRLMDALTFYGHTSDVIGMFMSSEGEKIMKGVEYFIGSIRRQIMKYNPGEIWILLDAVGSGLSIDGIHEIQDVAQVIIDDNKDRDVYFVVSTNEYEFTIGADCIDVTTFLHERFGTYNVYKTFILKTREKKNRRYQRNETE